MAWMALHLPGYVQKANTNEITLLKPSEASPFILSLTHQLAEAVLRSSRSKVCLRTYSIFDTCL